MEAGRKPSSQFLTGDWGSLTRVQWLSIAGIGAYLCFIPVRTTPDIATLVLILAALLMIIRQDSSLPRLPRADHLVVASVVIAVCLSTLLSRDIARSLDYLIYVAINMIVLLMAAGLRERRSVRVIALLIGLLGVTHLFSLLVASRADGVYEAGLIVDRTGLSTLIVPNDALILGLCFPALSWVLLDQGRRWHGWAGFILALYLTLSLSVCHLVQSKVALLALITAVFTVALFRRTNVAAAAARPTMTKLMTALFGFIVLAGGLAWYLGNQSTVRLSLWAEALTAHSSVKELAVGVGPNTFLFNPSSVGSAFDKGDFLVPWVHNAYLEAWYEQGLLGLLALMALTLIPVIRALRIKEPGIRTMVLASLVTFIVVSIFEVTLTRRFYFAFLAIFYGLALGHNLESKDEHSG